MNRYFCFLCLLAFVAGISGNAGCSRQHYRMKADQEVYSVLKQGNNDPRWKIDDYRITPNVASRMYSSFNPDCEPMPPDDLAAHRKMHSVNGMKGSDKWHDKGDTPHVENPRWRQYLLVNDRGEVPLDRDRAVELARLHSPQYQAALENLYLSAMAVSQQRYVYDVQFAAEGLLRYRNAGGTSSVTNTVNPVSAERRLAAGGQWIVELANSITWTLSGQDSWSSSTDRLLNASITQPLLRGAGRKVQLEHLTQAERNFLMAVRQMVLFQQGHYTRIVTGSTPQDADTSAPTSPFSASGTTLPTASGGFYGLLSDQIRIQNQRQNVIGLEENLNRFIELFDAGQVTNSYQVEDVRQNLLSSQSGLLSQVNQYQTSIETYVRSLGLPPDLKVSISDPLLEQFQLTSPTLTILSEDVADLLAVIRKKDLPLDDDFREKTQDVVRRAEGEIAVLRQDVDVLHKSLPERRENLRNLESLLLERAENDARIDPSIYGISDFEKRINDLQDKGKGIPKNLERLQATFTLLQLFVSSEEQELREMIRTRSFDTPVQEALEILKETLKLPEPNTAADASDTDDIMELLGERVEDLPPLPTEVVTDLLEQLTPEEAKRIEARRIIAELRQKDDYRDWVRQVFSAFQYELLSLSLMQTRTRLEAMTLVPVSMTPEEAFQIASENRLDWMNQRSRLVDRWRQIDIAANGLKGVLDLDLRGSTGTIDRDGVTFNRNNSSVQATLSWETPLNRYAAMMLYRRNQIEFQDARRDYYIYVDSVQAGLRNILREVQRRRLDFEINRKAVLVGATRVDVMQLQMQQPQRGGGRIDPNTSQQLTSALDGFMRSQNSLLDTWVAYQTQRMLLDMSMGTMKLDHQGRWIEPDVGRSAVAAPMPQLAPMVIPVPILETPRLNRRYVEEEVIR